MIPLYLELAQNIVTAIPLFIDLYRGQLEAPEDFEVITPSVMIGLPSTEWDELTKGNQKGEAIISVRYLCVLSSRVHASDPLISLAVEDLKVADQIHEAVRSHPNIYRRIRTLRYHAALLQPNAFVVEQQYSAKEYYERPVKTVPKPTPDITGTLKFPYNHQN